jgi:hypothetical protein
LHLRSLLNLKTAWFLYLVERLFQHYIPPHAVELSLLTVKFPFSNSVLTLSSRLFMATTYVGRRQYTCQVRVRLSTEAFPVQFWYAKPSRQTVQHTCTSLQHQPTFTRRRWAALHKSV